MIIVGRKKKIKKRWGRRRIEIKYIRHRVLEMKKKWIDSSSVNISMTLTMNWFDKPWKEKNQGEESWTLFGNLKGWGVD